MSSLEDLRRVVARYQYAFDEPATIEFVAAVHEAGLLTADEWERIKGFLQEAMQSLRPEPARKKETLVFNLDADPRNADWIKIVHASRLAGHKMPHWAALWFWWLGSHREEGPFWPAVGRVASRLGYERLDSQTAPPDEQLPLAERALVLIRNSRLGTPIISGTDGRWTSLQFSDEHVTDLRDRFRGALVGGAIGDAMGRPNEGRSTEVARERQLRDYQPWHGWTSGPKGTITDDTQMTMWLAEAIVAAAARAAEAGEGDLRDQLLDPDELATRFTRERIRGIGKATREFVRNYKDLGKPWYEAGVPSAGNGTAMRAAPVGLVHLGDPYRIYRDSLLQSVVTHRDSMAVAGATCQAYAAARAATALPGAFASLDQRVALCAECATLLEGLERPGYELRGSTGAASLHGRVGVELPRYLETGRAPFADWHNGAYVLESLPCALWCFLASPEDFAATLFAAVDAGHDADTVAAMACSVSGAYHGYARLPQRLLADLEYHDRLVKLADDLHDLHRRVYGAS